MIWLALRNAWRHKRRLLGTVTAVFLGVALLSGTLALGDTMSASIDGFFRTNNAGVDAVVRNTTSVQDDPGSRRGGIDAAVADRVRAVDGVAHAAPVVQAFGQIVGDDNTAVSGNGPRTAGNWVTDRRLNPWKLAAGRAPRSDDEVVIDKASAEAGDLSVGDKTTVLTPKPVPVTVVGIATFGASDTFGGTSFAAFTLKGAQKHLTGDTETLTSVKVRAVHGVTQRELVDRIGQQLPRGAEVVSGSDLTRENVQAVQQSFLDIFRTAMSVFAAIALLVAAFSIHNTFSILSTQRRRESALLRAIGASGRQVTTATLAESLVTGLAGSALGLAGGIAIAYGLKGVFTGFGVTLPTSDLVVSATSQLLAGAVGVAVTVLAAVAPAVRGARVPPLTALRHTATEDAPPSRWRAATGAGLATGAVVLTLIAAFAESGPLAAVGGTLLVAGVVLLGPVVAKPASRLLGLPAARLRGVSGALSRQNANRNPRRTLGSANALLVGVGVVTLFSVFAASLQQSLEERVAESFAGDLVVNGGSSMAAPAPLSSAAARTLARLPQVDTVAGLTDGSARVGGDSAQVAVGNLSKLADVLSLRTTDGSLAHTQGIAVSASAADGRGWRVGDTVPVTFSDGAREQLPVGAVFADSQVVGDYLVPDRVWSPHAPQALDSTVFVTLRKGADPSEAKAAVDEALTTYGSPPVQDRAEYVDAQGQTVGILLNLVYVMLVLAIIIALMGVANTLALSVYERTREIGLLRAVGQSRRQVRTMVRCESMIVALFGTLGGLGLGGYLGYVLTRVVETVDSVRFPTATLLAIVAVGALAGILAGVRPARRAARTDILSALATE